MQSSSVAASTHTVWLQVPMSFDPDSTVTRPEPLTRTRAVFAKRAQNIPAQAVADRPVPSSCGRSPRVR